MEHEGQLLETVNAKLATLVVAGSGSTDAAATNADATALDDATEHVTTALNVTIDALVEPLKPVQLT